MIAEQKQNTLIYFRIIYNSNMVDRTELGLYKLARNEGNHTEIDICFSSFVPLSLELPIRATTFVHCPVGIAVTKQRLWLVHRPFDKESEVEYLWPEWQQYEKQPPKHQIAFGSEGAPFRLRLLIEGMEKLTGAQETKASLALIEGMGIFDLSINQHGSLITIRFEERGTEDHFLEERLRI